MFPLQVNLVMLRASFKVDLCGENLAFLWLFTYLSAFLTTGEMPCSREAQFSKNAQHLSSNPPRRNGKMGKRTQNRAPKLHSRQEIHTVWFIPSGPWTSGDGHWWAPVGHQTQANPWNLFCSPQKSLLLFLALSLLFTCIFCPFPVWSRAPPSKVRGFPCSLLPAWHHGGLAAAFWQATLPISNGNKTYIKPYFFL